MSRKYRPTKIMRSGVGRSRKEKKDLNFLIKTLVILMLMFFAGRIFITLLYPEPINQIEVELQHEAQEPTITE